MKEIKEERFGTERALYASRGLQLHHCRFEGKEDGESALKESRDIGAQDCFFALRYPLWHVRTAVLENCEMTDTCRAALWYDSDLTIRGCTLEGIKAVRECRGVKIEKTRINSPEFGWKSRNISLHDCSLVSEYAFLESRNIRAERLTFTGKYSFQYTRNVTLSHSELHTKDAFWHAKNVTLTTQPFCYCKNLRLIDCTMENCDLSFEYSDVRADVRGEILSVKNVRRGCVCADRIGEVIVTPDSVYPVRARIVQRKA